MKSLQAREKSWSSCKLLQVRGADEQTMTIEEIKKLIEIVRETGISELEVEMGEGRVKIRNSPAKGQEIMLPTVLSVPVSSSPAHTVTPTTFAAPSESAAPPPAHQENEQNVVVKSPIVGTYYEAPSAESAPFVKIGDHVEPKQVLCIIESMKLMNEIEAEVAGTVIAKHVENGRPVEYGESLFTLHPA
jgi:acetyl-CoA carboxylase biotin carboxyl carrier protein